jgi:hypothetical protein
MRFMVQVRATPETEAGVMPSQGLLDAMMAFNEELARSGALVAADGLRDSSFGARLTWRGGELTVTDGPFPNPGELIAGFWIITAGSKAEVVEMFSRCPPCHDNGEGVLEIRQFFEMEDFPPEMMVDVKAAEARMHEHLASQAG